jgi:hypothetical protein
LLFRYVHIKAAFRTFMTLTPGAQQILFPGQVQSRSELNLLTPKKEFSAKKKLFVGHSQSHDRVWQILRFVSQTNKQTNKQTNWKWSCQCCAHWELLQTFLFKFFSFVKLFYLNFQSSIFNFLSTLNLYLIMIKIIFLLYCYYLIRKKYCNSIRHLYFMTDLARTFSSSAVLSW